MKKSFKFAILVFLFINLCGCDNLDQVEDIGNEMARLREQAVLSINDALNALQNNSSDWQSVLIELDRNLDKRIQDVLTYNIPYITDRANSKFLSSVLCVKESVKDDVIYFLQYIRAELITGVYPSMPHPKICTTIPHVLDLNAPNNLRNQIIYTGYNIHSQDSISARLLNGNTSISFVISKNKIAFPDLFTITLSIDNISDSTLTDFSHIQLLFGSNVISSISIIPKSLTPPIIESVLTDEKTLIYIPPHTFGDKEFDGNGPRIRVDLYLMSDATRVYAQIRMDAIETAPDWTAAVGVQDWIPIYTVKPGYLIHQFKEPYRYDNILQNNGIDYIDGSTADYIIDTSVGRATIVGDAIGLDAGISTKTILDLRGFQLEIIKQ